VLPASQLASIATGIASSCVRVPISVVKVKHPRHPQVCVPNDARNPSHRSTHPPSPPRRPSLTRLSPPSPQSRRPACSWASPPPPRTPSRRPLPSLAGAVCTRGGAPRARSTCCMRSCSSPPWSGCAPRGPQSCRGAGREGREAGGRVVEGRGGMRPCGCPGGIRARMRGACRSTRMACRGRGQAEPAAQLQAAAVALRMRWWATPPTALPRSCPMCPRPLPNPQNSSPPFSSFLL
jgi:hypothetical protein